MGLMYPGDTVIESRSLDVDGAAGVEVGEIVGGAAGSGVGEMVPNGGRVEIVGGAGCGGVGEMVPDGERGKMLSNGEGIEGPSISVVAGAGEESSSVRRSSMVAGAGEGCFGLVVTVALSESESDEDEDDDDGVGLLFPK